MIKFKINSIKFLFLVVFFVVFSLAVLVLSKAAPLSDTNDIFYVDRPTASSNISGTSQVRFRLYDDDNTNPEYDVGLFQSNCLTRFGTIAANDFSIRGQNNVFTKSWNSDGPILDRASVPNGKYCLKVCVTLSNNGSNYSVCDQRFINLTDPVNTAPVIVTNPPNTLLLTGQTFGYDVDATDADGDPLVYTLTTSPDFLQINQSTGAISTKGTILSPGSYSVVVRVGDRRGGIDTQQFTIVVEEEPTSEATNIEILSPTEDSIFAGEENQIKWNINKIDNIEEIILQYSTDGEKWIEIVSVDSNKREYSWDVSEIDSDDYILRITVKTSDEVSYEKVSERFSISSEGGGEVVTSVSIIDVIPREDSEIDSFEEIAMSFVPSTGAEIILTNVKLLLDDNDITSSCELSDNRLICKLESIEIGKHKVFVEVEDSKGQKASKQWFFDYLQNVEPPPPDDGDEADWMANLPLFGVICLVVLILLLVPWIFYTMWLGRSKKDKQPDLVETDYYYPDIDQTQPQPEEVAPVAEAAYPEDIGGFEGEDEFDIGEGSLGAEEDFESIQPQEQVKEPVQQEVAPAPVSVGTQPGASEQFGVDDLPDWLKGESGEESVPVDPSGQGVVAGENKQKKDDVVKGAEPYSDYGLAPTIDDDENS